MKIRDYRRLSIL